MATMFYVQQAILVYFNSNKEQVKGMLGLNSICHAYSGPWSRPYSIQHSHLQTQGNFSQPMGSRDKSKATPQPRYGGAGMLFW
jgi:hypothetical protein